MHNRLEEERSEQRKDNETDIFVASMSVVMDVLDVDGNLEQLH